jgi:hypothetical protein
MRLPLALVLVLAACRGEGEAPSLAVAVKPVAGPETSAPIVAPIPRRTPPITACPTVLEKPEDGDRVIGKSCGTVTVRKGFRVESGTLTLTAGATLAFEPGADLTVGYQAPGKLIVQGTAAEPVLFTSTGAKTAASWRGIYLYEHADGTQIAGLHLEYGGEGIRGPIYVLAEDVSIDDSVIRDSLDVPVHVSQGGRLASFSGNRLERVSSPAMLLPPSSVPAVAGDNQFPEGTTIHVLSGIVRDRVRWSNPGVPFTIGGLIEIAGEDDDLEALLELTPGTVLRFDEDAYINVGYYRAGALRAEGTAEAPIVFTSQGKPRPGAWRGINLYKNASATFSHVTFEYGSRRSEWGVLFANSRASLSVQDCLFRSNGGGVVLQGDDLRILAFARNRFDASSPTLALSPQAYAMVGEGNVLADGSRVVLEGGRIEHSGRWRDLGSPIEVTGPIEVHGGATLTVDPGVSLRVRDGFELGIGLVGGGSLRMQGTAEAPIRIVGINDRRGTWDAIRLHPKSAGNVIEHLQLRNAGGNGAVEVLGSADLRVDDLECARCYSPALTWACDAKVNAQGLVIKEGTPAEKSPPSGCGG